MLRTSFLFIFLFASALSAANNTQSLYEQGVEAFKSGNFGSSELLLRKIIDSDDSEYKDKAWYYLALSIFNQKKYTSAIFEFNRFLSSCTSQDLCSMGRYWIAESYYQQNDYIRAIDKFSKFIEQSKNDEYNIQALDRIGRIYFIQKRYDEAIIEWTKALAKSRDDIKKNQIRMNIGEAYFLNENYDESVTFLTPLINSSLDSKTDSMARMITGRAYQLRNKNLQAIKTFAGMDEKLLTEKPFNDVQYYRALAYISLGNFNFAALHLKTFLSTGKDSKWLYYAKYELAKIYIKENNIKDATDLLEDIRKSQSGSPLKSSASLELAKIYFDANTEESIKCLIEASAGNSQDEKTEAMVFLAKAYTKVKRYKEAETILLQLISGNSFDKNIDQFQFMLGTVYLEEGETAKSIAAFDKVKELNPFSKYINESYYYLAVGHIKNNQTDEAITVLNKYIDLPKAENKYNAYIKLLDLYTIRRNFKSADKVMAVIINNYLREKGVENALYKYGKTLIENNKPGKLYFNLILNNYNKSDAAGYVLLGFGDEAFSKKNYKEAEYYYRQYLSVQWRNNAASVFLYRIISLDKLAKYKDIISILGTKENIPPMDEFTSKQLSLWSGRSYFNTGEFKKAYDYYTSWRITDLSEDDILNLVRSSIKIEDVITARKAADAIKKNINLLAEAYYELSLYYISKKNYESASETLQKIINNIPSSNLTETAKTDLAEIYIKEDKFDYAVQLLKDIKTEKLLTKKNALLITIYFRIDNEKEALAITQKNFKDLLRSSYAESVIKDNLLYYYKIKDQNKFNEYAQYFMRYQGNNTLLNYLYAKLNFNNNNYKTAYYYFYKLSDIESEYKNEANYYLGLISILNNRDANLAMKYFSKISEKNPAENKYTMQGKIDISILSSETGNIDVSKKALFDILNNSDNRLLRIQAENLIEYFGYKPELNTTKQ